MDEMWRTGISVFIYFICFHILETESRAAIPTFLKTCHKTDPNLNDCVRESLETLLPNLRNGIEDLEVPPIDPLSVKELNLALGKGEVNLQVTMTEVIVLGLSQTEVVSVRTNVEYGKLEISSRTPRLQITGLYKGEGGVGYLPLEGEGNFNVSMVDITSAWMVYYREVALPSSPPEATPEDADEGSLGMEVETFALDVMPAKVSYYFDRFLDGDNGLGKAANSFLNENAHEVFNEVKGQLLKELGKAFGDIANAFLVNFRENQLWKP